MRAVAVFPNDKTIKLIDNHPAPQLELDTDVLIEMLEVGVCGTDKEIARFDYGTPPPGSGYLVIGHESLARVARIGSKVTHVKKGDLVVTMVRRPCPHDWCRSCRAHRQDFCFSGDFTERGIKQQHGFMTEQVVDDQRYMHVVPAHLRDVAILVEPLTIAEKALIQVWDIQERLPWTPAGIDGDGHGARALVLGAGPVGLLGALALIVRGFETWVYSRDLPDSNAAKWAEGVGAHYVSSAKTAPADLSEAIGNIDLVYEATGASQLSFDVLPELGANAVFCFTGVPGRRGPISVDGDLIMRNLVLKNQLVFGTVNAGPAAFEHAIQDLSQFHARWPDALRSLVTGRFAPEKAIELLTGQAGGIKNVVAFA
jgi:threonine dehydrogenase-like Zn-dependent dehydrogenase